MPIYKVKVQQACKRSLNGAPEFSVATLLVHARGFRSAMDAAERAAEKVAEFGPKWVEFNAFEAMPVNLPFLLETVQRR